MSQILNNIRIVLVGTLYSGNVGSVCRAMANMGISDLVLAAPRICDNWEEATRLAVHADDILANHRRVVKSVSSGGTVRLARLFSTIVRGMKRLII